eukprot:c9630_g1_i3.p1 GENE.c9630_g1_i3~~c9630_g1_i3.p1  ORF type:complete len:267 (+),score=86.51 c9630_g1_i3:32-802(+)
MISIVRAAPHHIQPLLRANTATVTPRLMHCVALSSSTPAATTTTSMSHRPYIVAFRPLHYATFKLCTPDNATAAVHPNNTILSRNCWTLFRARESPPHQQTTTTSSRSHSESNHHQQQHPFFGNYHHFQSHPYRGRMCGRGGGVIRKLIFAVGLFVVADLALFSMDWTSFWQSVYIKLHGVSTAIAAQITDVGHTMEQRRQAIDDAIKQKEQRVAFKLDQHKHVEQLEKEVRDLRCEIQQLKTSTTADLAQKVCCV